MSIEERIKRVLAENAGIEEDEITSESKLEEDLAMDSLDRVEALMGIEEEFDIEIHDDTAGTIKTVQDVFDVVANLI
jgi:acyl carrier protein